MNALRHSARPFGRRFASTTAAPAMPKKPIPEVYQYSFKQSWLSDSSTYPLIVSLTFCGAFVVGFAFNAFANYKDVQISSKYKNALIRDWGEEKTTSVTEALSGLGSYHKNPMGLGTSEWTKGDTKEK